SWVNVARLNNAASPHYLVAKLIFFDRVNDMTIRLELNWATTIGHLHARLIRVNFELYLRWPTQRAHHLNLLCHKVSCKNFARPSLLDHEPPAVTVTGTSRIRRCHSHFQLWPLEFYRSDLSIFCNNNFHAHRRRTSRHNVGTPAERQPVCMPFCIRPNNKRLYQRIGNLIAYSVKSQDTQLNWLRSNG